MRATRSPHARTRAKASAQNRYERFLSLHHLSRSLAPRKVHPESVHGRSEVGDGQPVICSLRGVPRACFLCSFREAASGMSSRKNLRNAVSSILAELCLRTGLNYSFGRIEKIQEFQKFLEFLNEINSAIFSETLTITSRYN